MENRCPEDSNIEEGELTKEKRKNKLMQDEFNNQRAKLRELYLQKEEEVNSLKTELNDLKSELLSIQCKNEDEMKIKDQKLQEEISSLQHLVQETIDESCIVKQELEKVQEENSHLKLENRELRDLRDELMTQQQDNSALAPVLNHVKKTLARKLVGSESGSHDNIDESMRKAQEDAEVLRSLVVPLEEEIKALKEKLRSTDEELQFHRNTTINEKSNFERIKDSEQLNTIQIDSNVNAVCKSTLTDYIQCDQCQNYNTKMLSLEKTLNDKDETIEKLTKLLNDSREELKKEAALRQDLEIQWQEKREAHKEEVQYLTEQIKKNEKELLTVQHQFLEFKENVNCQLHNLIDDRNQINKHLEILQSDNDFLSGKYLATAEELESQHINLPNNVEELQELLLKQRTDLIQARIGSEFEKRKSVSYKDEVEILREELTTSNAQKLEMEKKVQSKIRSLEERLKAVLVEQHGNKLMKEKYERQEVELNKNVSELRVQIIELQDTNDKLNKANKDLKSKMKILQDDLATSEQVQKDFVKLSQRLQIALEKFRQADTQVRWQDEDDIDNCANCNVPFTVTCRKQHCRHCGTIYCDKCLTKTVPTGPSKKLARVCDVCHTLLIPNVAPYYSQESQQSPN